MENAKDKAFGQNVLAEGKMQLKYCETQVFQQLSGGAIEKASVLRIPNQLSLRIIREIFWKANPKIYPGLLNQNAKGTGWLDMEHTCEFQEESYFLNNRN